MAVVQSARVCWLVASAGAEHAVSEAGGSDADVVILHADGAMGGGPASQRYGASVRSLTEAGREVFAWVAVDDVVEHAESLLKQGVVGFVVEGNVGESDLRAIDTNLRDWAQRTGDDVGLFLMLSSGFDVLRCDSLLQANESIHYVGLGSIDQEFDLAAEPSGEIHLLGHLLQRMVLTAHASGCVPIGAWWRAPARGLCATPSETAEAVARAARVGTCGALCARADQVAAVHSGFTGRRCRPRRITGNDHAKPVVRGRPGDDWSTPSLPVRRTRLFVPAIRPEFVPKAMASRPDVIVLDLEDSVPIARKQDARDLVAPSVEQLRACASEIAIRINHDSVEEDLAAAVVAGVSLILLPKVDSATDVQTADRLITRYEQARGIDAGSTEIVPTIETARGVVNLPEIVGASKRVRELAGAGGLDMARDLRLPASASVDQFSYVRGEIELHGRVAGLVTSPKVPLSIRVNDLERVDGVGHAARASFLCGGLGGAVLHPTLVPVVRDAYTPTTEDLAHAEEILGRSAARVSPCDLRRARFILDWAQRCAARDRELAQ